METRKAGKLFIISAPSGAGKTSLVQNVIERLGQRCAVKRVITYTTKKPRVGEVAGVDYHFLTEEEFKEKLLQDYFVEYSTAYGAYYGFPRYIINEVAYGASYMVILDRAGAAALKAHKEDVVLIWIKPPTHESLRLRLTSRGQDDESTIAYRLALAQQELELEEQERFFQHSIMNDDFHGAVEQLEKIVRDELSQDCE